MLKSVAAISLAVVFMMLSHIYGTYLPYRYLPWLSVALVGVLYLIITQRKIFIISASIAYGVISIFELRSTGIEIFFIQNLIFVIVIMFWWYFVWELNRRMMVSEFQKVSILESIRLLREKYAVRLDSLNHLERQVGGLLDLFEIAKDFNECLYFSQLIATLNRRAKEQMAFKALTLTLFDTHIDQDQARIQTISIGRSESENLQMRDPDSFDKFCISQASSSSSPVKFITSESLSQAFADAERIVFPLWIFPLQVEGKPIAILTIEGALEEHFPKYELLASQLALQVKKISLYERVKELSIVDGLTKVYVRRHFLERFDEELKRAVKRKSSISVLMLDIDHFKSYNDNFGHLVGDSTLKEVAQVISESVRRVDLVARYGGEEFIVAMPEVGYKTNLESAERIRSAVARKSFRLYDEETKVTISIGVASYPEDVTPEQLKESESALMLSLIQKADKALYRAKEEGRNRVVSFQQLKSKNGL